MRNELEIFANFAQGYGLITNLSLAHKNIIQWM